jgi:DNA-directed RNA polymerase beta' subunit
MEVTWIIGLATVAIILLPIIWKLLDKKIALIKNEKLRMALEEISDVAENVIEAALETTVEEARKQNKGKLTPEAGAKIKEEVVDEVIKNASRTSTKILAKEFADDELKGRVGNLVEVGLSRIKERRKKKK